LLSARAAGLTRIAGRPANWQSSVLGSSLRKAHPFSTSQRQQKSPITRNALEQANGRLAASPAPKMEMNRRMQQNISEITAEAVSLVLPGACIRPAAPRGPGGRNRNWS
jgi:hypothetical protein